MALGLEATFEFLTNTDNEAAIRILVPALDSRNAAIQESALRAILKRRTTSGSREILDRMPKMKPQWLAIIRQHQGRLTGALREAILGTEPELCEKGCRAAVMFHDYDLIPTLLSVMEGPTGAQANIAAKTIQELVESLYEDFSGGRDPNDRRDPQMIRRYVVGSLEQSVLRYVQHRRREVIEAFLLLVSRDNVTLNQILQNPRHAAFVVLIDVLSKCPQRGIIRLLLNFLDDPRVPSAALSVIANRSDARYVHYLLRKIGREPTGMIAQNLKRIESIGWFADRTRLLEQMDDASQQAAVRLATIANIPRQQSLSVIEDLLLKGKPGGRQDAARALGEYQGTDANALAMIALDDPDPIVQSHIVSQLRGRGIPGVLPLLLELVDSPYPIVQKAAREGLAEFSFKRFLGAFDLLDEQVRHSTGSLVKKIDNQAVPLLMEELKSPVRTRRLRGLAIAAAISAVGESESVIIELMADEDHMVRAEAASALVQSPTASSITALQQALTDTSEIVRQAAKRSLQELTQLRPFGQES